MGGSDGMEVDGRVSSCQHESCDGNVLGLFQLQSTEPNSNQFRQKNKCGRRTLGPSVLEGGFGWIQESLFC